MLRRAIHHQVTNFNVKYRYEQYISKILEHIKTKQTKITNLFHK